MKISNFKLKNIGNMIATFNLELQSGLELREMKIVNGSNGMFPSFPSRQYEDRKTGEKKFWNLMNIPDPERRATFQDAVMKAVQPFLAAAEDTPASDTKQEDIPF